MKTAKIICSVIILLLLAAACGSDSDVAGTAPAAGWLTTPETGLAPPPPPVPTPPAAPASPMMPMADAAADSADFGGFTQGTAASVDWEDIADAGGRHIIQNASVTLECEEFDTAVTELRGVAARFGGYVENEMLTNHGERIFSLVIRVPAAQFEDALAVVQAVAALRHMNQQAQDVTAQFHDMVGSLETRRIEEERILALIEDARDINDILALEARLSNVRLVIQQYLSALTNMAGQIAFSTINVTLFDIFEEEYEEEEEEPYVAATAWERITGAFGDSVTAVTHAFQSFAVWMAGAILPIIIAAAIVLTGWVVVRKYVRRANNSA